jgi:Skp family chaperone for outer membrane proteins
VNQLKVDIGKQYLEKKEYQTDIEEKFEEVNSELKEGIKKLEEEMTNMQDEITQKIDSSISTVVN